MYYIQPVFLKGWYHGTSPPINLTKHHVSLMLSSTLNIYPGGNTDLTLTMYAEDYGTPLVSVCLSITFKKLRKLEVLAPN